MSKMLHGIGNSMMHKRLKVVNLYTYIYAKSGSYKVFIICFVCWKKEEKRISNAQDDSHSSSKPEKKEEKKREKKKKERKMNLSLKYTLFAQSISCIIFLMHVASMQHYTVKESLEKKKKFWCTCTLKQQQHKMLIISLNCYSAWCF